MMRLLILAFADSIHTQRCISNIEGQGWDIHLFSSIDCGTVHPHLKNTTVHQSFVGAQRAKHTTVVTRGIPVFNDGVAYMLIKTASRYFPGYRVQQLTRLIRRIKPDLVHSMEIQHAGYLALEAKKVLGADFPPWLVTNWGSDISLFGLMGSHREKIKQVLAECDYYSCECKRDVLLAREFGFTGETFPVFPNTGGFDLERLSLWRSSGPTSQRRKIVLKGYQDWAGRALAGLRALERCKDLLREYEIHVFSATKDVETAIEIARNRSGLDVRIVPKNSSHEDILRLLGEARIAVGLSIGDGISTSLLEAMVMGAFPIQSWTSCADEWVSDGTSGILVPPEDPDVVEAAIRKALTEDELIDRAALLNWQVANERLCKPLLQSKIVNMYEKVLGMVG